MPNSNRLFRWQTPFKELRQQFAAIKLQRGFHSYVYGVEGQGLLQTCWWVFLCANGSRHCLWKKVCYPHSKSWALCLVLKFSCDSCKTGKGNKHKTIQEIVFFIVSYWILSICMWHHIHRQMTLRFTTIPTLQQTGSSQILGSLWSCECWASTEQNEHGRRVWQFWS